MTKNLLILRPHDGALETGRRARERGLKAVVDPLFAIDAVPWSGPQPGDFDALLLTSANVLRFGGPQLESYLSLPVLAVGAKTAAAARTAGFTVALTGGSGAQGLLRHLEEDQFPKLLWLSGEQHSEISTTSREVEIVPVYRAKPSPLGHEARACLAAETVILVHSVRAARHLVAEMERLQVPKSIHHLLAISVKVAEAAGRGWKSVQSAEHPDDDALLSLASALCRTSC